MAEIAIPLIGLGAMYLISNNKPDPKEGFHNNQTHQSNNRSIINRQPLAKNYPIVDKTDLRKTVQNYNGHKSGVEHYFNPEIFDNKKKLQQNTQSSFVSLNGNKINANDLEHNNMVPYFGSKITQNTQHSNREGLLDTYTGMGKQRIKKTSNAPFFKNEKHLTHIHGQPNSNDFYHSRMRGVLTQKMNNVKPWKEQLVGPGLCKGYVAEGSDGFNSALTAREYYNPKTVNELRVKTNPKMTYGGRTLGAYKPDLGKNMIGKIEKRRPDTWFENDKLFTTTGIEKAPTQRSTVVLHPENRSSTTREYFGGGANQNNKNATYQAGEYSNSHKQQLCSENVGIAGAGALGNPNDMSKKEHRLLPNSRTTTGVKTSMGFFASHVQALTAPIIDIIKPSKKSDVIGNARPTGNVQGKNSVSHGVIWNPSDKTKTTIKEQTENNYYIKQGFKNKGGGYYARVYQPTGTHRDTTTISYTGGADMVNGTTGVKLYDADYNAQLNVNRELVSKVDRYNIGNQKLYNGNIHVTNLKNRSTHEVQRVPNMPKIHTGLNTFGELNNNARERNVNEESKYRMDRMSGIGMDAANVYNSNPYAHPLGSVA